jgi:hypothetical protein
MQVVSERMRGIALRDEVNGFSSPKFEKKKKTNSKKRQIRKKNNFFSELNQPF